MAESSAKVRIWECPACGDWHYDIYGSSGGECPCDEGIYERQVLPSPEEIRELERFREDTLKAKVAQLAELTGKREVAHYRSQLLEAAGWLTYHPSPDARAFASHIRQVDEQRPVEDLDL